MYVCMFWKSHLAQMKRARSREPHRMQEVLDGLASLHPAKAVLKERFVRESAQRDRERAASEQAAAPRFAGTAAADEAAGP